MNVEAQCVGTSTSDTAVAVLPYAERAKQGLRNVKLDDLNWPLGRPERLSTGCVGDMLVNDHLITYPKTKLYFGKEISAKLSLMIVEPDVIHKKHLFLARIFQSRFHRILTKNTEFIQRCNNAIFFIYGASQIQNVESLKISKTENCSLIASARNKLQGHQLRHEIVEEIRKRGLCVSILGRGYQPFGPKEDGLASFMYSVVIENSREAGYFTEKIVDACLCRTVPIYWGAPDIGDYFDLEGVIVCQSAQDILAAIKSISANDYEARHDAIKRNVIFAKKYADVEMRAALEVLSND